MVVEKRNQTAVSRGERTGCTEIEERELAAKSVEERELAA